MRDAQGMVPLHVALSTGAAEEVVLKVLEAHGEVATPLSLDVSASYRMVPLDYTPGPCPPIIVCFVACCIGLVGMMLVTLALALALPLTCVAPRICGCIDT